MFMLDIALFLIELYYIYPLVIFIFPKMSFYFIYNNWLSKEKFKKFEDLDSFSINSKGARNFYLKSRRDGARLGIWQMLPYHESVTNKPNVNEFELALTDETPIFILYHGDGHHRGARMHVGRQKFLSRLGFHVLTMDYRGFGDSEGIPKSDMSLADDAITLYEYVRQFAPSKEIYLFSSSLGCGISSTLVKVLSSNSICKPPAGLVMDACFDSFTNVMLRSSFTYCFLGLIGFRYMFLYNLDIIGVKMDICENLKECKCPITLVHSEDDLLIDFTVGKHVFQELSNLGLDVHFYNFGRRGFGHNKNYRAEEMPKILNDLIKRGAATTTLS